MSNQTKCGICLTPVKTLFDLVAGRHTCTKTMAQAYEEAFSVQPKIAAEPKEENHEAERELFQLSIEIALLVSACRQKDSIRLEETIQSLENWLYEREEKLTQEQLYGKKAA